MPPVRDVAATAAQMRQALANPREAAARAGNAGRRVESMSIATMADAYEALYESLLARTG